MNIELKYQSTGDNDSIEDALIAISNIKTIDGKYVDDDTLFKAIQKAWRANKTGFGVHLYEKTN